MPLPRRFADLREIGVHGLLVYVAILRIFPHLHDCICPIRGLTAVPVLPHLGVPDLRVLVVPGMPCDLDFLRCLAHRAGSILPLRACIAGCAYFLVEMVASHSFAFDLDVLAVVVVLDVDDGRPLQDPQPIGQE